MKVLNLYAGVGGNRKLWTGVDVVAVEENEQIAAVYQQQYPNDTVIISDAHQYLLDNYQHFDFIWSSPPCQSHSRMMKATRHPLKRYPDMSLYQEIIFLKEFFKGKWVVENVTPYYEPLIRGKKIGRHMFWSNFHIRDYNIEQPADFITKGTLEGRKDLMNWLGIQFDQVIYYKDNHCPVQVLRNCVHPQLGLHVFNSAFTKANQLFQ